MAGKSDLMSTLKKRPDPLTSVALTIPVFLIYHLGILLVESRSGVDLVSNTVFGVLKASAPVYVVGTLSLAFVLATVTWIEERRGATQSMALSRVLGEGVVFSLLALACLGWAAPRVLRTTDPARFEELGALDKIVLACGTGFHQEFIFRAVLVAGFGWLLLKLFRMNNKVAMTVAVIVSSIAFSLIHHYGPFREPFHADVALIRVLLGVVFAVLFLLRGFAVAVYAHVFFNIMVLFLYT
ncbi:MAG TPA: CPBP family intramembrane glutamic endopeptidase [Polyangiales bacterium]|nr:CPBP family intramembrane glutamic endopeptidase [Polyangiales bacterium]